MPEADAAPGYDAVRVEAAIARVLQAERDARDRVEHCAREAEAIVESAREQARQIARRAAHRSIRVQRWSAATLRQRLAELAEQQARAERDAPPAAMAEQVAAAVQRLAAELTGAAP